MDRLRCVTMYPLIDGPTFTLTTWDTGHTYRNGPQWCIRYELKKGNRVIFSGEDFGCSPMHAIDSDECLRGLLGFFTLCPDEMDDEYFEDYTPEQLEFVEIYGDALSLYTLEEDPQPWDWDADGECD